MIDTNDDVQWVKTQRLAAPCTARVAAQRPVSARVDRGRREDTAISTRPPAGG